MEDKKDEKQDAGGDGLMRMSKQDKVRVEFFFSRHASKLSVVTDKVKHGRGRNTLLLKCRTQNF